MNRVDEIDEIIGSVGRVDGFPTVDELDHFVDELAAAHPARVMVTEIGRSRAGAPIREVCIGSGERHIVVLGNPHPNEPIGMATIRHLLGRFAEDETRTLGAAWHFVPCVDPDGTRLNEGWFAGPLTRTGVARAFYRPPKDEQPEWCFPTTWRGLEVGTPMPETRALMTLIDRTRPALIASLHNGDFGGGFFYCSGGDPDYWSALIERLTDADVPIHRGEPDAPGARLLTPGVFELPSFAQLADAMAAAGAHDPVTAAVSGGGSLDYAAPYGSAGLVCELPLWVDARVHDDSIGERSIGEVMRAAAAAHRELAEVIEEVLGRIAGRSSGRSPFERAVRDMRVGLEDIAAGKAAWDVTDRPATRGEIFTEEYVWTSIIRLRAGGMLIRLLDDEIGRDASPELVAERNRFGAIFDRWCAEVERDAPGECVPLDRLVSIQAAAIAIAARRLRDGLPV
ncbi:M14 family zinc carboxypeptidase [Nocardia transvalensis]|uniref:M14 family zinc carboxypeptidase n=1 Tax=Nocardia transvalensis TaxID=37333 RepID=UPI001894A4F9|nr:M14 family zinc carboxypeptidase [Nocardia transvalensis]MBF6327911.1 hypothetical protein [Nocardia transvalensis]